MHDHVGDVGSGAAQPLLDLARPGMRFGERRGRVEPQREEGDDALLRPQQPQLAQRATGGSLGSRLDLGCLDELACTCLREWLEVGLHRGDLPDGADDRTLDLLRDLVRLVERQVAGQLQMERDLVSRVRARQR